MATAAPGDAVTGQTLIWREVLEGWGIAGGIFAEHVHPEMAGDVERLDRLPRDERSALLLHYSLWSKAAERALEAPPIRLGMVYHNVTPGHLLKDANPTLAALCDRGRKALPGLAGRVSVVIADSSFNARDLLAAGFSEPSVVPLLLPLPAPPPAKLVAPPVVLTVGRVVPNKRIEDVIHTVAVLRRHLVADARLVILGGWGGFESYRDALGRFTSELGIEEAVTFTGFVTDAERDLAYAEAGAYLCMSEHEGFCQPLIEAMARGLPVVARGAGAVAETLGGAGLVIPGRDIRLAAEALGAVLTDHELRQGLASAASRRIEELSPARLARRLESAVAPLVA